MKKKLFLKGLLIGGGLAMALSMAGLLMISLWIGATDKTAYYLVKVLLMLGVASIVTGGFSAGYYAGILGWLHGALIGLAYSLLILLVPRFLLPQAFIWEAILKEAFFYTALAAFAGVVGVNYQEYRLKRRKRVRRLH